MQEDGGDWTDGVAELIATYGMEVLGGIILLAVGWWVSGLVARVVRRLCDRTERIDAMLTGFIVSVVRWLIRIAVVLAVLDQFGIETTSLIAVLGAAGLAVGLALQGTLSNVAAGVMLLVFRPFKVGDFVAAAGLSGTVKDLNLFVTEFATPDNVQILVPNKDVWGSAIENFSFHPTRRQDIVIGIDYADSIDAAMAAAKEVVDADSRVLADPAAQYLVTALGDNAVDVTVRVWCNAGDYWALRFELTKALKEKMDQAGITIPFPQRVVTNRS